MPRRSAACTARASSDDATCPGTAPRTAALTPPPRERPLVPEIFLLSLGVLLLEVSYTRVFSYKFYYYFTYAIIGIALLGLGTGSVFLTVFPRLRRLPASRLIPAAGLVAGASVGLGYLVIAATRVDALKLMYGLFPVDVATVAWEGGKLWLLCACLFVPFLAAGLAVASILLRDVERVGEVYGADLLGAGLGCALAVPLLGVLSPPGCVMLAGLVFVVAGLRLAVRSRPLLAVAVPLAGLLFLAAIFPGRLPDPVPDPVKTMNPLGGPGQLLFSSWGSVYRVDVVPGFAGEESPRLILHDGLIASALHPYDGNPRALDALDADVRSMPFAVLPPGPRVLIIGAAGGQEILASLHFGAAHVTAVELNPVTLSLLTTRFASLTGHLADDPRVTLVNDEGRSFLRRAADRPDLIWFVAPDSYAAMNAATSGAFVLSESYLYTEEMVLESMARLAPDGLLCVQFGEVDFERKPNRTARYLTTAREAFRRLGITDFDRHVLVGTTRGFWTTATILLRRSPWTPDEVARFAERVAAVPGSVVRYAPGYVNPDGAVERVVTLAPEALEKWYADYPFDVRPVTDDAPFFWHFVPFRGATAPIARYGERWFEEGTGERLLLVLLVAVTAFAAVVLLAPVVALRGAWRAMPHKLLAGVYFGAIGTGFMLVEVSLIQRFTLFLGFPTHSLTVTLCALLVSSGIGSLWARGRAGELTTHALRMLSGSVAVLLTFHAFGLPPILLRAVGWPLPARVTLAAVAIFPLGACLGMFMPIGLRAVARTTAYAEEFVAWSWAVNCFFSVVSSVLAAILAMTLGFTAVLLTALAVYLVGVAALTGRGLDVGSGPSEGLPRVRG
ncbi:MAG TPA: hypothetical protein VE911_08885 [Candidatus Nitrosopolaris sp.]|nr:hypothetical protein [Candidatus Nitrosopolaris sp.]